MRACVYVYRTHVRAHLRNRHIHVPMTSAHERLIWHANQQVQLWAHRHLVSWCTGENMAHTRICITLNTGGKASHVRIVIASHVCMHTHASYRIKTQGQVSNRPLELTCMYSYVCIISCWTNRQTDRQETFVPKVIGHLVSWGKVSPRWVSKQCSQNLRAHSEFSHASILVARLTCNTTYDSYVL